MLVLGPPNQGPFNLTVGVPFSVTGLSGAVGGKFYLVAVQDQNGTTVLPISIGVTRPI